MDSDAKLQCFVGSASYLERADGLEEVESHGSDLADMTVTVSQRKPTDDHVGIAYCLHLIDVVMVDDAVEQRVEIVEEVYYLFKPINSIR